LILEAQGQTLPIEIKSSVTIGKRNTTGLKAFLEDNPRVKHGYIIYPGEKIQPVAANITALPDWWFLGSY
jgi:predicted AAA+ superfamily ATPase